MDSQIERGIYQSPELHKLDNVKDVTMVFVCSGTFDESTGACTPNRP